MTDIVPQPFTPTPQRPYPGGEFRASRKELAAMHAADAEMRLSNLARYVIERWPDTDDGRAARRKFLHDVEKSHGEAGRLAVETRARALWLEGRPR